MKYQSADWYFRAFDASRFAPAAQVALAFPRGCRLRLPSAATGRRFGAPPCRCKKGVAQLFVLNSLEV